MELADRLLGNVRVDDSGCWIWTRYTDPKWGYGYTRVGSRKDGTRRTELAHRTSYAVFVGPIPAGIQVLHKCDIPPCINPDHLFLGTHNDNMIDATIKGRKMKKLRPQEVIELRQRAARGEHLSLLAETYGVTYGTAWAIVNNKIWRHDVEIDNQAA